MTPKQKHLTVVDTIKHLSALTPKQKHLTGFDTKTETFDSR